MGFPNPPPNGFGFGGGGLAGLGGYGGFGNQPNFGTGIYAGGFGTPLNT